MIHIKMMSFIKRRSYIRLIEELVVSGIANSPLLIHNLCSSRIYHEYEFLYS
jgi:hypothetical protein